MIQPVTHNCLYQLFFSRICVSNWAGSYQNGTDHWMFDSYSRGDWRGGCHSGTFGFPRHSTCTRNSARLVPARRLSGLCLKLIKHNMDFNSLYIRPPLEKYNERMDFTSRWKRRHHPSFTVNQSDETKVYCQSTIVSRQFFMTR